jgi:hypothetical protein
VTTIKAAPPAETPAGLVVAPPPKSEWPLSMFECRECDSEYRTSCIKKSCTDLTGDVFALAVPCPTCGGLSTVPQMSSAGEYLHEIPCPVSYGCNGSGWVHHGDYRVLEVLPIVAGLGRLDDPMPRLCVVTDAGERNGVYLLRPFVYPSPRIDLPGAVPGGVALAVEEA